MHFRFSYRRKIVKRGKYSVCKQPIHLIRIAEFVCCSATVTAPFPSYDDVADRNSHRIKDDPEQAAYRSIADLINRPPLRCQPEGD